MTLTKEQQQTLLEIDNAQQLFEALWAICEDLEDYEIDINIPFEDLKWEFYKGRKRILKKDDLVREYQKNNPEKILVLHPKIRTLL